jgi:hypothetical protein
MQVKYWSSLTDDQKIERWENVLRVLRSLTPHQRKKHWDMGDWGRETECGTVACAAGHCGLDPWFRRRGFQLNFVPNAYFNAESDEPSDRSVCKMPVDPERFFGYVGYDEIFTNGAMNTVDEVIVAVKAHIKQLKKEAKENEAA